MLLSLPVKHTGFHWTLAPGSRLNFMHWSEDFLQVALCPLRVQSQQRGKKSVCFPTSARRLCVFQGKGLTCTPEFAQSFLRPCHCCSCPPHCSLLPTHQFRFLPIPRELDLEQLTHSHLSFDRELFLKQLEHDIQLRWMDFTNNKQLDTPRCAVLISLPFLPARCFTGVLSS